MILDGCFESIALWERFVDLLEELESLPKSIPWNGLSPWKIDISVHRKIENGTVIPPLEWENTTILKDRASAVLVFSCKPLQPDNDQSFDYNFAEILFKDFVKTFIFITNISHPGCFIALSILTWNKKGEIKEHPGLMPHFHGAIEYINDTGWPELKSVPFADVYRWVYLNGFHVRSGDTSISRAFNAFTWLFAEGGKENPFSLVSTLIGIEALFCTSSSGVTEQVRRRAQLLLGKKESFKKDLTTIYSVRSSFIHGRTLLSANGYSWSPPEETWQKMEKTHKGEDIASAVLIASLQKLAINNWNSLDYQEEIAGHSKDDSSYIEEITKGINIPMVYAESIDKWLGKYIKRFEKTSIKNKC